MLDLAYDVQAGQAATAGYFGGYTAKMQPVGKKDLLSLEQSVLRRLDLDQETNAAKKVFATASRRLVRDLEGKGIIRTALETTNLVVHSDEKDVLRAECI